VVVEVILERVTNIAMSGKGLADVNEFEALAETAEEAPTSIAALT